MNKIIEELKKDFSSPNPDYHSGVNDGMYKLNEFLKGNHPLYIIQQECKEGYKHQEKALEILKENEYVPK